MTPTDNMPPPRHRRQLDNLPQSEELFQSYLTALSQTEGMFLPPDSYHGSRSLILQSEEEHQPLFTPDIIATIQVNTSSSPTSATVFIGLRRGNIRCSYLQSGLVFQTEPCASDIIEAICECDCIPGRTISKWPQGEIFVGTSQQPIDIESDNYQHHSTRFQEIGRLHELLDTQHPGRAALYRVIEPAAYTERRAQLVETHGLNKMEQVYVLYIWEEVSTQRLLQEWYLTTGIDRTMRNRSLIMPSVTLPLRELRRFPPLPVSPICHQSTHT
jgi:hypothetical protein